MFDGQEVAVKKLHPRHGLDDKEFDNEFRNLREIRHPNVVRLLGYCYESRHKFVKHNGDLVRAQEIERALCFEYMQGGSLDKHISGTFTSYSLEYLAFKWFSIFICLSLFHCR